eukprot:2048495-Rhodomonas_salina.1
MKTRSWGLGARARLSAGTGRGGEKASDDAGGALPAVGHRWKQATARVGREPLERAAQLLAVEKVVARALVRVDEEPDALPGLETHNL